MKVQESFATRLSLRVVAITLGALLLFGLAMFILSATLIRSEAKKAVLGQLELSCATIESAVQDAQLTADHLSVVATSELLKPDPDFDLLQSQIHTFVESTPCIDFASITLEPSYFHGREVISPYTQRWGDSLSDGNMGSDHDKTIKMDWYTAARDSARALWSSPYMAPVSKVPVYSTYAVPIYDADHRFIGNISIDINNAWLSSVVKNVTSYSRSYVSLIAHDGTYIIHPDTTRLFSKTIFDRAAETHNPSLEHLGRTMLSSGNGSMRIVRDGESVNCYYSTIASTGWILGMVCPTSEVYKSIVMMAFWILVLILIFLLVIYLIVSTFIRQSAEPLHHFAVAARKIGEGKFDAPIPDIYSRDEIRELHDAFAFMQWSLANNTAQLASASMANQRFEGEVSLARKVQLDMVPASMPKRRDLDFYAVLNPARESSGNIYDYAIEDDKLYFSVGDVSGKGIPSTLFMSMTYSLMRTGATRKDSPATILSFVNGIMAQNNTSCMYVTLFVGILDLTTGQLRYCSAGHDAPIVIAPDGSMADLDTASNLPIGVMEDCEYQEQQITIPTGGALLVYTDGITQAEASNGELYGIERLRGQLRNTSKEGCEQILRKLRASVQNFTQGNEQDDDVAAMAIRYLGGR